MTVERWAAVTRPLTAKLLFTPRKVVFSLAVTAVLSAAVHAHNLFVLDLISIQLPPGPGGVVPPGKGPIKDTATTPDADVMTLGWAMSNETSPVPSLYDTGLKPLPPGPPIIRICGFQESFTRSNVRIVQSVDLILATALPFLVMLVFNITIGAQLYRGLKFRSTSMYKAEKATRTKPEYNRGDKSHFSRSMTNSNNPSAGIDDDQTTGQQSIKDAQNEMDVTTITSMTKPANPSLASTTLNKHKKATTKSSSKEKSTTATLLLVTTVFLLLNIPRASLHVYRSLIPNNMDTATRTRIRLGWVICDQLLALNSAINILLYCATGRRFRKALWNVVCWKGNTEIRHSGTYNTGSTKLRSSKHTH